MSCSEWANVLAGVVLILRTSSGPTFDADHTAIDTAHPQVVDRSGQASVRRMTAICGPPRFCSSDERLLSGALQPVAGDAAYGEDAPDRSFTPARGPPLFVTRTACAASDYRSQSSRVSARAGICSVEAGRQPRPSGSLDGGVHEQSGKSIPIWQDSCARSRPTQRIGGDSFERPLP